MNLQQVIQESSTSLVDVREPYEYANGHAAGAINIPLGTIPGRVEEFRRMPGPIVVYCQSGGRSGRALAFLKSKQIDQVYNAGGVADMIRLQSSVSNQ